MASFFHHAALHKTREPTAMPLPLHVATQRRPTPGFTLPEFIICLVIAAILAAIALPKLQQTLHRQRAISAQNALVAHLHLTRATALWRRQPTLICPTVDGNRCSHRGDWGTSWLVFLDPDGDGRANAPYDIIRVTLGARQPKLRVFGSAGRSHVRYLADGRSAGSNQTIRFCDPSGALQAAIIINNSGRVRSTSGRGAQRCPP
ncbi:GspH/FimT family pseudopilin [Stenotrophomonas sp. UBA7606]|nr:GspH/FimT family pseudopilin [Stenotrophomonas sp. UBA7606]